MRKHFWFLSPLSTHVQRRAEHELIDMGKVALTVCDSGRCEAARRFPWPAEEGRPCVPPKGSVCVAMLSVLWRNQSGPSSNVWPVVREWALITTFLVFLRVTDVF